MLLLSHSLPGLAGSVSVCRNLSRNQLAGGNQHQRPALVRVMFGCSHVAYTALPGSGHLSAGPLAHAATLALPCCVQAPCQTNGAMSKHFLS